MLATNRQNTIVRPVEERDVRNILQMVDTAWRVYLRTPPLELRAKLKSLPGILAEDSVGLRGFMVAEPQPPNVAFLVAAGLRDTWHIKPYVDLLLPPLEQTALAKNLSKLVYIGNAVWLIEELWHRGFQTHEWVISLERVGAEIPPTPPTPAVLRPVRSTDLNTLINLDGLTFDEVWHYAVGNIADALFHDSSFVLAELAGQIVGYEWCELYAPRAHLTRLAVHPDYQGRGIGAQLLHRALTDASEHGVNQITLNTQENNYRSLALYQRFGFRATKQRMPLLLKKLR
jgi:ribosomal protein S18 acetylase RimI-like enzyme